MGYKFYVRKYFLKIFYPTLICRLFFAFLVILQTTEVSILMKLDFSIFFFLVTCIFCTLSKKLLHTSGTRRFTPVLSSNNFILFSFIFRPFIHFELIVLHDDCNFILLHIDIVIPTTFFEKIILSPFECLCLNQFTIKLRVYFWTLNSILLTYMSILTPVPHRFYYCALQ